jgi:nickel and cobalt resistance protein CnrR
MKPLNSRLLPLLALLALVASVAAISCFVTEQWVDRCYCERQDEGHAWIHQKLGISPGQEAKLEPIEIRYAEEKRHHEELMKMANRELAQAILEDKQDSEKVRSAVDKIHHAMGGMQKATINHLFEMKTVLNPEQYEQLLQLTAQGLQELSTSK